MDVQIPTVFGIQMFSVFGFQNCYIILSGEVEVLRTANDQQGPPVVRLKLVKSVRIVVMKNKELDFPGNKDFSV